MVLGGQDSFTALPEESHDRCFAEMHRLLNLSLHLAQEFVHSVPSNGCISCRITFNVHLPFHLPQGPSLSAP